MAKPQLNMNLKLSNAMALEKANDLPGALTLYEKVSAAVPTYVQAWSRQMVILRKLKQGEKELQLIKKAIRNFEKATNSLQQEWMKANKEKIAHSRKLADAMGLLGKNGLPQIENETIVAWKKRLDLLASRLEKRKHKKQPTTKGKK